MAKTTVSSGFFSGGVHFLTPIDGSVNHGHTLRLAPEAVKELRVKEEPKAAEEETPAEKAPPKRVRVRK